MPTSRRSPRVQWLTFVMKYLRPAVKHGEFEVWTDREMEGGAELGREDRAAILRACHIFVLLVSPNSMSSNYIIDKEIRIARERKAAGDDLHVYPLLHRTDPRRGSRSSAGTSTCGRATEGPFPASRLHRRNGAHECRRE